MQAASAIDGMVIKINRDNVPFTVEVNLPTYNILSWCEIHCNHQFSWWYGKHSITVGFANLEDKMLFMLNNL